MTQTQNPFAPLKADTLFFYSHTRADPDYRGLSNFEHSPFQAPHPLIEGNPLVWFKTMEHHFNAHKTLWLADFEWIRKASTPRIAKRRGSRHGESGRQIELRPDWATHHRYRVMLEGLRLKYTVPALWTLLDSTGGRMLAEDSPSDYEWGCRDVRGGYTGLNLLGRAIMRVRSERRGQAVAALTDLETEDAASRSHVRVSSSER